MLKIGGFRIEELQLCSKDMQVHSVQPRSVREQKTVTQARRLSHEVADGPPYVTMRRH